MTDKQQELDKILNAVTRMTDRYVFVATYRENPGPREGTVLLDLTVSCNDPIKQRVHAVLARWVASTNPETGEAASSKELH